KSLAGSSPPVRELKFLLASWGSAPGPEWLVGSSHTSHRALGPHKEHCRARSIQGAIASALLVLHSAQLQPCAALILPGNSRFRAAALSQSAGGSGRFSPQR